MKNVIKILLLFIYLLPQAVLAQDRLPVRVAQFKVNGPEASRYLGGAAQDAIVGALLQKGWGAQTLPKTIDPEKLKSVNQGGKLTGILVTGRINVVGNTYRVFLKWIDHQGRVGQEYLQVANLDDLLPKLETFAAQTLQAPPVAVTKKEEKKIEKSRFEREILPPPPPPPEPAPPPPAVAAEVEPPAPKPTKVAKPKPQKTPKKKPEKSRLSKARKKDDSQVNLRDYDFVSARLPFEVRSLAYGDVNGDGKKEVLLTSQRKLYLYSFDQGQMDLMAEFPGAALDYFVKVDLWKQEGQSPIIVLTNLRKSSASSKLLKLEGGQLVPIVEKIPYMLRVVKDHGVSHLMGATYNATSELGGQAIVRLKIEGDRVKNAGRIKLPWGSHLYNYAWVKDSQGNPEDIVVLSKLGKLRYYRKEEKKYKKAWTSRGTYGGSGNYMPVQIKNYFNEVTGSYYSVPVGVTSYQRAGIPEVVVVKNNSLVKNVIGRVPIISSGQIFRLSYDDMGFVEAWASKKVDGSIQDYLVTSGTEGQTQLMAAVRLRDPGLFGEIGRNDSVILLYNLN